MTSRREWFAEYTPIEAVDVVLGDGSRKKGVGTGKVLIKRYVEWLDGWLEDVLHVPRFEKNLFSTNVSTRLRVVFEDDYVRLLDKGTGKIVAQGQKYQGDICRMMLKIIAPKTNLSGCSLETLHKTLGQWHWRNRRQEFLL